MIFKKKTTMYYFYYDSKLSYLNIKICLYLSIKI